MNDNQKDRTETTRRSLCLGIGAGAALFAVGGLKTLPAKPSVRPPGGQDEDRLLATCVRCGRCIAACRWKALRPAQLEDGILGVRLPTVNFDNGWCDFCADDDTRNAPRRHPHMSMHADGDGEAENPDGNGLADTQMAMDDPDGINDASERANGTANPVSYEPLCAKACPTGALSLTDFVDVGSIALGKAVIIREWCLAWGQHFSCHHCYSACPQKYSAIQMDEYYRPVVIAEKCVGCGACQTACISLKSQAAVPGATSRAIIVVPESQAADYQYDET